MNTLGTGTPWKFSHFRKTDGYANMPLDGVWLRAPYLHNGSVPTLRALLFPEERPAVFYRGYDVYDWHGSASSPRGPRPRRAARSSTPPCAATATAGTSTAATCRRRARGAHRVPEDPLTVVPPMATTAHVPLILIAASAG